MKLHPNNHTFSRFGFWYLPSLAIPLVLFLFSVQSSPPQEEPATSVAPLTKRFLSNPSTNSALNQRPVKQALATANPVVVKAHNPHPQTQAPKKPQAKTKKRSIEAKAPTLTPKPKAEPKYTAPAIEIRVAIAVDATTLAIGSSTEAQILDANGRVVQQLLAAQAEVAQPIDAAISLGDWQLPSVVWIEPTQGGAVYVGDRAYRGRLLLVSQGNTLLAVNYVDLEQYLTSVVGSEMSASEPIEALKAQATAARSYAMVHLLRPANNLYDLGASQRWQVYKGLSTEYNTTQTAVALTAGQILSYKGGIVESTYAATDEIVAKAHSGWGMSQNGATKLAMQGYEYRQILAAYYPGVEVARLEIKQ